jgi:hypothetical protein
MPAKLALGALVFALTLGSAAAQPDPKKADDKKLVTKTYSIKSLIGERGKASGLADADAVIKLIFQSIPQLRDLRSGGDGPQIIERDGGKLEVRATEARHEEIKELITALERLQDLAIDVKAQVIELTPADYEKLVKALPKGKTKPPVLSATGEEFEERDVARDKAVEEANKILKTGRVVQTSSGRFVNGLEATVSARRMVVTFSNTRVAEALGAKTTNPDPMFVKEGFSLVAAPVVSADRRFVRFKLTEQSTVISGVKKRDFGEIAGQKVVFQTPETEDLGSTGSATVADGGTLIFKLAYAPKDKAWVVVLHPTIFIQTEEDILKKEGKKP